MLLGGILLGLITGLLAGGRLRWIGLIFLAVIVRFATEAALGAHLPVAELFRLPLFAASFGMLLVGLWQNRSHPGLTLAFVGILSNATAVVVNGGFMPIWEPSLVAAGFGPDQVLSPFHT